METQTDPLPGAWLDDDDPQCPDRRVGVAKRHEPKARHRIKVVVSGLGEFLARIVTMNEL
jgi:hypothetical protein